eukprot:1671761-Amphidinium_carterae.2
MVWWTTYTRTNESKSMFRLMILFVRDGAPASSLQHIQEYARNMDIYTNRQLLHMQASWIRTP